MSAGADPKPLPEDWSSPVTVLVVDQSETESWLAGAVIEQSGWGVEYVRDGASALAFIQQQPPSVVLTELHLPDMDGLEVVKTIRRKFPVVPVIILTQQGSDDLAFKALKCGAASYLPKRLITEELAGTIETVLTAAEMDRRRQRLMGCMTESEQRFVLGNDSSLVPSMVTLFQESLMGLGVCQETSCIRAGIALEEALLNAIYHGNLEVSSDLRRDGDKPYREMIELRRRTMPYASRRVFIHAKVSRSEACFNIKDEGPGFDPASLPDPTDPANLESTCGRGLLLIRTFMDQVRHNPRGNEITLVKHRDARGG